VVDPKENPVDVMVVDVAKVIFVKDVAEAPVIAPRLSAGIAVPEETDTLCYVREYKLLDVAQSFLSNLLCSSTKLE
jgi:hypothetical protein